MPKLYIISGCNGAGKTTASFTILPEILNCKEFVNADEIAKGLSPFQPEKVAFEAGRIMLKRLDELLKDNVDFAFETTLASKTFAQFFKKAKAKNYEITLIFFWLNSVELAIERVKTRVEEGGHDIPTDIIIRRYNRGLKNFFSIYEEIVDNWMFIDNSGRPYAEIAKKDKQNLVVNQSNKWKKIKWTYEK